MVELSVRDGVVHLDVLGWARILAFASTLDIPLRCIKSAVAGAAGLPKFRWGDLRLGGTSIPRLFAVGTFSMGSPRRRSFLDLRRASKEVVVLELENCGYDLVMVEVSNADRALKLIAEAKESSAT